MRTVDEVRARLAEFEQKAAVDLGRPFKDRAFAQAGFWGHVEALEWVLGDTPNDIVVKEIDTTGPRLRALEAKVLES